MRIFLLLCVSALVLSGCMRPGKELARRGQEMVVCGRLFHVGAPVVLWTDPGGYDAYRTEKRFVPWPKAAFAVADKAVGTPNRYGVRFAPRPPFKEGEPLDYSPLTEDEFERVRGGGWDLELLRRHVDQFVLHYDVCGVSRQCFRVLHDFRGLSVHFLLDIDGTIYQTMDLKERGWHATISNDRSVGIEIANMGAYGQTEKDPLDQWYEPDPPKREMWEWWASAQATGAVHGGVPGDPGIVPPRGLHAQSVITIPDRLGDGGVRRAGTYAPARPHPVIGTIHGRPLLQMDLTPEQYASLIKLTAALHRALPRIELEYPRDEQGRLLTRQLTRAEWESFSGVIAHYHIQEDKVDPGPALQWDTLVRGARRELGRRP